MKKRKRLLSVILTLTMAASLMPALTLPASAADTDPTPFYVGNAMRYDDTDDSLSAPYLTAQLDNITMEAWVKADTLSTESPYIRIMYNGNSSTTGYGIYLSGANKSPCVLMGSVGFATVAAVSLNTSQWYHLAAVRDSGVWKFYVNGTAYALTSNALGPNVLAPTDTFTVGNSSYNSENFTGSIDEVRFWTVARTAEQIQNNMYIKLQGDETGLLAYYNFDQADITPEGDNTAITTVTDVAGGDQNLTISGFTMNGDTSNFVQSMNLGTFQIENTAYSAKEDDGNVTITIVRTDGSEGSVTINYETEDGTAAAGTNYTATSGSVIFAEGETSKSVQIPVINQSISDSKTFTFSISGQDGISIGADDSATVTITPAEPAPVATAEELSAAFASGGRFVLDNNIVISSPLTVPSGKTVVLDLEGHTIDRGLAAGSAVANGHVITVNGSLTIIDSATGGKITGGNTTGNGGGLYVGNGGSLTMTGGTVGGNSAAYYGGGVYVANGGSFIMSGDAAISANNVTSSDSGEGGGVHVSGGSFTMSGSAGVTNNVNAGYLGGGVYVSGGSFTMSGSTVISGNSVNSYGRGGGVCVGLGGSFTMNDGGISGNIASNSGGGVNVESYGSFTMSDGSISGNHANYGGGVKILPYGVFSISGTAGIKSNTANYEGGGINAQANIKLSGGVEISGNTLSANGSADNIRMVSYTSDTYYIQIDGALANGANICVRNGTVEMDDSTVASDIQYFHPDLAGYLFYQDGGYFKLGYYYIVTYNANGGSGAPASQNKISNVPLTLSSITPTRSGFTFQHWNTAANNSGTSYSSGASYTNNAAVMLYAHWAANTYTINYDPNGGTVAPATQTKLYGSTYGKASDGTTNEAMPTPIWAGHTFSGWYTEASGGTKISDSDTVGITDDTTLYAQWTTDTYTVTFNPNGGTVSPSSQVKLYGSTYGKGPDGAADEAMPAPIWAGHTFSGWYTEATDGTKIADSDTVSITGNTTLYAHWTANADTGYTVRHYCQNVSGDGYTLESTESLTGTTDATATASAKSYTGFTENTTHADRVNSGTIAGDGSLVLTLYYDRNTYTVSYSTDGGSTVTDTTGVRYGAGISAPTAPTKAGYTFDGWYKEAELTNAWNFSTDAVTTTTTLYAKWTTNTYTVTYDPSGGTVSPTSQTKLYGSTYGKASDGITDEAMPTPTWTGHTFSGWYTAASGGTEIADSDTVSITEDTTLYAQWTTDTYTVTYEPNGGTVSPTSQSKLYGSTYGKASDGITDEAMPTPTWTGHTFSGWYTAASGGTKLTDSDTVGITENTTLYAQWTTDTYTVTYEPNGGTVSVTSQTKLYGSTYGKAADGTADEAMPTPTWAGHTFSGWYTAASDGTEISDSDTVGITEGTTLYAQWTTDTYTVTYEPNGGTVSVTSQTKLYGSTYGKGSDGTTDEAMPTPTWTGHTFSGWYTAASGGTKLTDSDTVGITENTTLYAQWTTDTYTVTYESNGGTVSPTSQSKLYGSTYGKASDGTTDEAMPTPTWAGHTFSGWYTAASGGTKLSDSDTVGITENTTLYAQWTTDTYTVTFNPNGGTVSPTSQTKLYGSTYGKAADGTADEAMPTPTWAGHTFSGWYTAASDGTEISDSDTVGITEGTTLYAQWTTDTYTVTFNPNGGTVSPTSQTKLYGSTYGKAADGTADEAMPTPTWAGHTFSGWYTAASGGTNLTDSDTVNITEGTTLYAQWTTDTYTVTYEPNGGTVSVTSQSKLYGSTYGKASDGITDEAMPTPTWTGHTFSGWYTAASDGTNLVNSDTVNITENTTLYAQWTTDTYTVTFNPNGGTVTPTSQVKLYGSIYGKAADGTTDEAMPTPTWAGHTFSGWYTAASGGTKLSDSDTVGITEGTTLYAQWTTDTYTVTFNPNGGTVSPTSQTKLYGSTYGKAADGTADEAMPTPTWAGHTFSGWYTAASGGTKISDSDTVGITEDVTLYAQWTTDTYTVTYGPNGGTVSPTSQSKLYGSTYGKAADGTTDEAMPTPTWAGHTFSGWYTAASGGTKLSDSDTVGITENTTLYAQWTTDTYTVTYDPNGGTVSVTSQTKLYGSTYGKASDGTADEAMPTPTWAGHTFSGWYTAASGGTKLTDSDTVDITDDTTLYAQWATKTSGGSDYTPSRTITVTETTSDLFTDSEGQIEVKANMTNAFSDSIEVKVTDTGETAAGFGIGAGNEVYPFDISLYIKGTSTKTEPKAGYAVTISLPVPNKLLDVKDRLSVMHKSDDGTVSTINSQLKQINGVWYLVFEATEFSPYALLVKNISAYDESAGLPYYVDSDGNTVFVGFAANGKYVAPSGVTVLFRQNAKTFTDTGSHWAKGYIEFVTERELFNGTGDNRFSPDAGMTRAMFATVIGRLYERSYGEIEDLRDHAFSDCNYDDYYGKYVGWAAKEGIIGGYGNGTFGPDDQVTREQMAAILYRFADFLGVLPGSANTALTYPDVGAISNWAQSAALYCQSSDIITGRNGGMFAPEEMATRAEVAAIIKRFIESVMA